MHQITMQPAYSRSYTEKDKISLERRALALDALFKLTNQFSKNRDFQKIIDILLMTLCGQLSVADSFAVLQKPDLGSMKPMFFATGSFKSNSMLASLETTKHCFIYFLENRSACEVKELRFKGESEKLGFILAECKVNLVCPLVHNDKIFGLIAIGERVTNKPYDKEEINFLTTISNTVTPFLANAYMYWEIVNLNAWHWEILNNVKQGVFVFDSNNRLKKVNLAGLDILKISNPDSSDLGSLYQAPIEFVFPDTIFGDWAKQFSQVKKGRHSTVKESMVAQTGETKRIFNVGLSWTTGNSDSPIDLIITLDDITVQKENEQRLFDLQRFAEKGLLASSISHELNNLLALIAGGIELIQFAQEKGDSTKMNANLKKLRTNITSMERFTSGLRDYTKLVTSKKSVNLNTIITDVLSFVSVQSKFQRITISCELDTNLPEFLIDSDQIAQLLLNFLNNAADAIHESGKDEGRITIGTVYGKEDIILFVSDNGVGIKPEVKEKLFKTRLTTKEKGHGFGMVTCSKIIENHEGNVTIDSEVGKGTTFTIRFPIITKT